MTGDEAVALGFLAFALISGFLLAVARIVMALVAREFVEGRRPDSGEGLRAGGVQSDPWDGTLAGRSLPRIARRIDQVLPALTANRYALNGVALVSLIYLLLAGDPVSWVALSLSLLGLLAVLKVTPHLAYLAARRRHRTLARVVAPAVLPLAVIGSPIVALFQRGLAQVRSPLAAAANGETAPHWSESQILIPVDEDATPPDERDLRMIQAILEMGQRTARDVMVPRVDLVTVSADDPLSQAAELMVASGHRRVLVYEENIDQVLGILHARDLLPLVGQPVPHLTLRDLVRPATFIPENKRLDELLPEFLRERVHIAVVIDEYGGTAGLVTLADVMEEIVGEVVDEFHHDEPEVVVVSEDEVLLDARVHLDYLKDRFSVEIEADGFDTVGGLVFSQLGKIPNPGDEVTAAGLRLQVLSTTGRRISRLRVARLTPQEVEVDEQA